MMDQPQAPKMSGSRGALLSLATNSAFRWSSVGEVTESLSLHPRSMDEFYPELRVHLERPPESFDCVAGRTFDCRNYVASPQSPSPTGRNTFNSNGCQKQDKVLCLIGETIVVRDLDQKLTGVSKDLPHKAETIEFKVDYMQDDSYLQVTSEIHKEESQKRMYGALGVPCIESALDGYNTTILAYGQTGSGKTYTMMGDNTRAGRGLIPRLANDLMRKIHEESSHGVLYTVQVSYLEIYQEKIRDLLAEDDMEEEAKPPGVLHPHSDSNGGMNVEKVSVPAGSNREAKFRVSSNNVEEKVRSFEERVMSSYTGSLTRNSYTSSFLNKAALQRQLEAQNAKHIKTKIEAEKSPIEKLHSGLAQDGDGNKVRSPKTKPAFDTIFSKQKVHKHYRTFPTVMDEAAPVRKQHFLKIREHPITGPFVEGLLWKDVYSWYDMENLMKQGSTSRTTAATDMNEQSSRSHAVFSIRLTKPSSVSYINLVDLAGSEKLPKLCSGAVTGQRTQEESRCINRSLSQLNEVILSLSKSSFVSYRNSVLTWLLKESLGGNGRTFMVANVSPTEKDLRESINTLRYATTASRIPPPVALDQDPRNKLIKKLKEEICTLRTLLSTFTSVRGKAPSGQLPSLQVFKVPCLDVGLQVVDDRSHEYGRIAKKHNKGNQTENHLRDAGQQTTSKSGSFDLGFQIALKDSVPLDMGDPRARVVKDSRRVYSWHQALILNVCACESGHQASPCDSGVLEVTISQHSALGNCGAKDACLQITPQSCSFVYLGQQTPLNDCGVLDGGNQIGLRDWGYWDNLGNKSPMQNWENVASWNRRILPHGGNDDRAQVTMQKQGDVDIGKKTAFLVDEEDVHATKQITIQNEEVYVEHQTTSQKWKSVEAGDQKASQSLETVVGGNQITWEDVNATNQIILHKFGDINTEGQISLSDWALVDVEMQTSCRAVKILRDLGMFDTAHQTNPTEWGSIDASHQTRLLGSTLNIAKNGNDITQTRLQEHLVNQSGCTKTQTGLQGHDVNKDTECTKVLMNFGHQVDWREFGASDVGLQVTPQKLVTKNSVDQVGWVDFGASESGNQISWRDFGTSDVGHQVTVEDHRHRDCNSKDHKLADDEPQVHPRGFKLFDFGRQMTFEHPEAPRSCEILDTRNHVDWKATAWGPVGRIRQLVDRGSDAGHEIEPMDLRTFHDIGIQTTHNYHQVVDRVQQTNGQSLSTSNVQLQAMIQTSQVDFETNAANQVIIMHRGSGIADLVFPVLGNDGGNLRGGANNIPEDCLAETKLQESVGQKLEKPDQRMSLHSSTTHVNCSPMTSKEIIRSKLVNRNNGENNCDWASNALVGFVDIGDGASLRVGRVGKLKEQFERRKFNPELKSPPREHRGILEMRQESRRFVGGVSVSHQTNLEVEDGKDEESQTDWKCVASEICCCCDAIDVGQKTNWKSLEEPLDLGLLISWDRVGAKDTQGLRKGDIGVEFGCQAAFDDDLSTLRHKSTSIDFSSLEVDPSSLDECRAVEEFGCQAACDHDLSTLRHKSTSTDFNSFDVDPNGLDKHRAVETWKRFQCGVCGARVGTSMAVESTTVSIQEVAIDIGLQTSWIDFCAMESELQTPATSWGVFSDVYPISPKPLASVDEGSQVDWEELHPLHEQHWNQFGADDIGHHIFATTSKSLDLAELQEEKPSTNHKDVHGGREDSKSYNSGCQNCEQDYDIKQWHQHQACHEVGREYAIRNSQQNHKIILLKPSYSVHESNAETYNTVQDSRNWNSSWGSRQQNSQITLDYVGGQIEGLQSVSDSSQASCVCLEAAPAAKLNPVKACASQQWTACRAVDTSSPARDFPALECIIRNIEERISAANEDLKNDNVEEATGDMNSPTKKLQKYWPAARDFCLQSHLQRVDSRINTPAVLLEVPKDNDGVPLRANQDGICLSWLRDITSRKRTSENVPAEEAFHLCSLWTLAKLRSRMELYNSHSERNSFAKNCRGLVSESTLFSKTDIETQTDPNPEDSTDHKMHISNAIQHLNSEDPTEHKTPITNVIQNPNAEDSIDQNTHYSNTIRCLCLLWAFVILRAAACEKGSLAKKGKRQSGKKLPHVGAMGPRKLRILSRLSDSATNERHCMSRRDYQRPAKLIKHLRYSGVEPLTFKSSTPFFIQTSGDCSLVKTTRLDRSPQPPGNKSTGGRNRSCYKIMCGFPSRRVVHFLKEGVNHLGSNRGAHIVVNGFSEDHSEFIYMPAHRCMQKKGYVVARLVAPGAMAFLNGQPMLEHRELCTGDVLILRDLRFWSSVCTLHFFDLVKCS